MSISSSEPTSNLVSCIAALCTLILLYCPLHLSPVFLLTALLLLFLLLLGALQSLPKPNPEPDPNTSNEPASGSSTQVGKWVSDQLGSGLDPDPKFEDTFVEWDVRAPLEVIYEAYEEEEEDADDREDPVQDPTRSWGLERYGSLSGYYPGTDSDSDSFSSDGGFAVVGGWDSVDGDCFKWEEEDREGLLIEIAIHGNRKKNTGSGFDPGLNFHAEEDNLIEIDISPAKNDDSLPARCS